ncbi:MAG: hypothetical protein ABH873_08430 [Candidatus Firestonebacteria bacterium]
MSEPKNIREVHELLRRMQENKKVDPEEVVYYLKNALFEKNSHGIWIKREEDSETSALSVVKIDHEKELVALRLNAEKK